MSRVAKNPIVVPAGVQVTLAESAVSVKGPKGQLSAAIHPAVAVSQESGVLSISPRNDSIQANEQSGTARAVIQNMVAGVSVGFERRLVMVGVGYRAQAKGEAVSLSLGYSHPIEHEVPAGIVIETPSQTEIVVKGCDKQLIGQVAANIRAYRPPEPYKGKGIRYSDEVIARKEAKKK